MTIDDLHEDHGDALQRQAMRLARDPDVAADLVQDTLVRALSHLVLLEQLMSRQQRAWLTQTLKRLYLDRRAAAQREAEQLARYGRELPAVVPPDEDAGFDPFDLVPPEDRPLVEQRYRLGLSSREIAAQLGIPAATVRWRLHRAVQRLRAHKAMFL